MISFRYIEQERTLLRIIPHRSTLNSMNRRIWFILHGLMAQYNPVRARLVRDGLHFTLYSKQDIWWVVSIKAEQINDVDPRPLWG